MRCWDQSLHLEEEGNSTKEGKYYPKIIVYIQFLNHLLCGRGSDLYPVISQPTGEITKDKQQLNSQLLPVTFNFVLAQFQIKTARFPLVFPKYLQFCTQIVLLYFVRAFYQPTINLALKSQPI